MPLILAFDTATDRATSALVDDGEVLGERVSRASTLLADVDALVRQAGAHPRDVTGLAVGIGPAASRGSGSASQPRAGSRSLWTCPPQASPPSMRSPPARRVRPP